jgi:ketosteroid isomerase-like protein
VGAGEELTRALFRKLAEASHPDKAADEADRVRRTEIMKRLTVAYRAGDLATLVELERTLETGASIAAATSDDEHAALVRVNAALGKQVRALDRELREVRQSKGQLDATSAVARESIERYRAVHAFVIRFRDGKMSLAEFLRGPQLDPEDDDLLDEVDPLVEVLELLEELARSAPPPRRPSRRRR